MPGILHGLGVVELPFDENTYAFVFAGIGGFAPLLSAVTLIARKKGWKGVWQWLRQALSFRVKPVYIVLALLLPLVIHVIAHYLVPVFGLEVANTLFSEDIPVPPAVLAIPFFFVLLLFGGGQEEFGWRGYAQEPLQKRFGITPASLLLGVIWGLWHLPVWLFPGGRPYSFLAFVITVTSMAVVFAWLYNASGKKVVVPWFLHTMWNTAMLLFPSLHMMEGKPETAYWLYAAVNVVATIIIAIWFIKPVAGEAGKWTGSKIP